MSYNYTLRYRTFDQLLSDCQIDFQNYNLQNMIEPQQLIKVAKRVSYDLGLRIQMTKETILELERGRVKLPDDFNVLNYGMFCHQHADTVVFPQGTHIEERPVVAHYQETNAIVNPCTDGPVNCQVCQSCEPCSCAPTQIPLTACAIEPYNPLIPFGDSCIKPRVFLNCKGDAYELVQIVNSTQTNYYSQLIPIRILENAQSIECGCEDLYLNSRPVAWIKDNYLYSNIRCAKLYISYQGAMEDDEGNLLVPDHDMINEYYEYAIKKRILENLIMNDETVSQAKIQLIQDGYKTSRNYALSIVNTPNFAEFKKVFQMNRKAQYAKYYNMFKSYSWYQWDKNPNDFRGEQITR